ncbi:MAG: PfkB family carbohydrate kinase [Bacteroidales bacterium]|nr:PfkB family carbohydrate kinase [Bacteroidales bacterium]
MTKNTIDKIFQAFSGKRVLIIGDVMVDAYLFGLVDRISPEAPVPVVSLISRDNRPGGAANVALNVQSLGAEAILCSVIGNDRKGEDFIQSIEKSGLTTRGIIKSKNRITTTKNRIIGNKTQLLRVDEEITTCLNNEDFISIYDTIEHIVENEVIDAIIFEDYDKGVITKDLIEKIIFKAQILDIPVVVDPKKKNFYFYKKSTIFKPNLKELLEGTHTEIDIQDEEELFRLADNLIKENELKILMTTLSERGVMVAWRQDGSSKIEHKIISAHLRNIADVSGAGDTVVSVVSLCHAVGLSPEDTASIANIAGGLVCEEVGVVPINKNKLYEEAIKILSV